jgi:hypothetical protein
MLRPVGTCGRQVTARAGAPGVGSGPTTRARRSRGDQFSGESFGVAQPGSGRRAAAAGAALTSGQAAAATPGAGAASAAPVGGGAGVPVLQADDASGRRVVLAQTGVGLQNSAQMRRHAQDWADSRPLLLGARAAWRVARRTCCSHALYRQHRQHPRNDLSTGERFSMEGTWRRANRIAGVATRWGYGSNVGCKRCVG